ncbi:MAG: radical SAM protein [Candidatus Lokiarchaeota archaeon]|nr:radical SAM protein [Candidatus Harpocratesius repetitus]
MGIRVLIIDCLTAGRGKREFTRDFIGSGPRYVSGFIEMISNEMVQCNLIRSDYIFQENSHDLEKYPIIGFSAMTMDIPVVKKLLTKWKKVHPQSEYRLSFLGGPITCDEHILRQISVDFAIIGQAELALHSIFSQNIENLTKSLINTQQNNQNATSIKKSWKIDLLTEIPGITYFNPKNQQIILNSMKSKEIGKEILQWFKNGTGFPEKIINYPDYAFSRIYIECLRGCSNFRRTSLKLFNGNQCKDSSCQICRGSSFSTLLNCPAGIPPGCGFCSTINQFGWVVSRNIKKIIEEVNYLIKIGAKRIVLGGPDILDFYRDRIVEEPLINPNHPEPNYRALETLINGLLENPKIKNHEVQIFYENVKASLCTERALSILSKIPSPIFSIGCETGSSNFADLLGRPSDPKKIVSAVKQALAKGIRVHVYFIHSLPGDTPEFARETLSLIKDFMILNIDKITLYKYQELPGSPFWKISKKISPPTKEIQSIYRQIKRLVINFNKSKKLQIIGEEFRVYLTEINQQYPSDAMGWILEGGPKVSVINGSKYIGSFQNVRIIKVLSDRLVLAEILK